MSVDAQRSGLSALVLWFFAEGIENSSVNQQLRDLFPDRLDLCAEFKRLYIYDCYIDTDPVGTRWFFSSRFDELKTAVKNRGLWVGSSPVTSLQDLC